jgi:hypothetical protein
MASNSKAVNIYVMQGELANLANIVNKLKKELNDLQLAMKTAQNSVLAALGADHINGQIETKKNQLEKAKNDLDKREKEYGLVGVVNDFVEKPSAPPANDEGATYSEDEKRQKELNSIVRNIEDTKKKINANMALLQQREAVVGFNNNNDELLNQYKRENSKLRHELDRYQEELANKEREYNLNGVYEPAPYVPTQIATHYGYQPDYMDTPPLYSDEPSVAYDPSSRNNYSYYRARAGYNLSIAATVAKHHLTPEEYKDKDSRTWKKTADYVFSGLLLAALMAASYDYITSDDTKSTLVGCTYGLAGLALSYAFFVGWAMIKDKEIEYAKNLAANKNELGKVLHPQDHLFHMKMRTRWGMAALFSLVGFAVATSLQPEDIEFSAPGLLLAPITAICIAMTMNHLKYMEAAQKDPNYRRKSYTELFKENFVTIIVAAIGLALIYNNAVVMNSDYASADAGNDAYRGALNLTARVGGGLFASAGLLIFIQSGINAMLAAMSRDKELDDLSNDERKAAEGAEAAKHYYYNTGTKTLSSCTEANRSDLGTKVIVENKTLENTDRRNNAIVTLVLGLAFYAAYWSLSGEITMSEESTSFTKKAITVSAAFLATLCFLKASNNTEKHFNKIGRVTFSDPKDVKMQDGSTAQRVVMSRMHG